MRIATKEDIKVGVELIDQDNNVFKIVEDMGNGLYEALNNGRRNGKVIFDTEAKYYKVGE